MKKLVLNLALLAMVFSSYAQENAFTLQNQADQRLEIKRQFDLPGQIEPFTDPEPISGLVISGNITLNADSSLVRVLLIDKQYNEYLVYEAYPLITESRSFPINEIGEETALLNNVVPSALRIELIDASFRLSEIVTSLAVPFARAMESNLQMEQTTAKIIRINRNLEENNIPWVAGETSLSQLSYQEKKAYFGGDLPNLHGFEYYTGGIFLMPGALEREDQIENNALTAGPGDSPYVKEFSWNDVHGQDWVSPVKNQSSCGSCWAFAAVGATELMVNLYFNQLLNLDLSEQQIVSCASAGSCSGGYVPAALDYIRSTGVVEEGCFPYTATNGICSNMCQNPGERVRIASYQNYLQRTENNLKKLIMEGAMAIGIIPWRHAITLVGYKTLNAGDRVYIKSSEASRWVSIDHTSPLIGQTAWLIKNSWGSWWGDEGYAYIVTNLTDIWPHHTCRLLGPVSRMNHSSAEIVCTDNDGDGYYFWGIGPKPEHCPPCPDEPDGDDSNACVGPRDVYGHLQSLSTPQPAVENVSVFRGQAVPDLVAVGTDIKWYSDYNLNNLVYSGNSFSSGQTAVGIYTYYVTQTLSDCESVTLPVYLTILDEISPPEVENEQVCHGKPGLLHATGENIRWYSDPQLNLLLFEGNDYTPSVSDPGYYKFYVTQTIEGIESTYSLAEYFIVEAPQPVYVDDKTFCSDSGLFMYAEGQQITWYSGNFSGELYDDRNNRTYRTVKIGTQVWMAENLDIGTSIAGSEMQQNNGVIERYHYNNDPTYGNSYGGLYQWEELMAYSTEIGDQGICPAGWHVPSHEEWQKMEVTLGMTEEEAARLGLRGTDEGALLKQGGNSGFESLLGGKRNTDGYFESLEYYATYWTSDGYTRTLSNLFDQVYASKGDEMENGFSVRCILDDSAYVSYGRKLDVSDYTPGDYTFYVTNTTYDGCISKPDTATLHLRETPPPPVVSDLEVCVMEDAPVLTASGEHVKWYHDIPGEPFVDERNGRTYNMLRFGRDIWMAENLDIGTMINGSQDQTDNQVIEKYYYNNDPSMGEIFGGLYQWDELMSYSILENSQGICPAGWEVPSHKDWMKLEMELGMNQAEATLFEWRGTDQGTQLKEGGSSGFEALMGGKRDTEGQFKNIDYYSTFWNSTRYSRSLVNWYDRTGIWSSRFDDPSNGFSVRCIMNDSAYTTMGNEFTAPQTMPGIYSYEVTQTIEGCESRSASVTLTIKERPLPPEGVDVSVCEGEPVPALLASGENVNWYNDAALSNLLHTGNEYQAGEIQAGTYSYFVTGRLGDCESIPDTVVLSIKAKPDPPSDTTYTTCGSGAIPDLSIEGENINWFTDEALLDPVFSGNLFATGKTEAGTYTWYVTETIQECVSSPSTVELVIGELPLPPLTQSFEICEGDSLPQLEATGENIRWYGDEQHTDLIHTGASMIPEFTAPGSATYYVTQNFNLCESLHATASLTIKASPEAPVSSGLSACEGEDIPALVATGDSIRWYDTPGLENVIHMGPDFASEQHAPGSYLYYATQTRNGCESLAKAVELTIKESPIISLGNDTTIRDDEDLILGPYPIEFSYLWSNISSEPYLKIMGGEIGPGDFEISVQVSNNQCIFRDTIILTVKSTIGINPVHPKGSVKVYPNPTDGLITLEFDTMLSEEAFIEIIDSKGALVKKFRIKKVPVAGVRTFEIMLDSPGIYYLHIFGRQGMSTFKLLRY